MPAKAIFSDQAARITIGVMVAAMAFTLIIGLEAGGVRRPPGAQVYDVGPYHPLKGCVGGPWRTGHDLPTECWTYDTHLMAGHYGLPASGRSFWVRVGADAYQVYNPIFDRNLPIRDVRYGIFRDRR